MVGRILSSMTGHYNISFIHSFIHCIRDINGSLQWLQLNTAKTELVWFSWWRMLQKTTNGDFTVKITATCTDINQLNTFLILCTQTMSSEWRLIFQKLPPTSTSASEDLSGLLVQRTEYHTWQLLSAVISPRLDCCNFCFVCHHQLSNQLLWLPFKHQITHKLCFPMHHVHITSLCTLTDAADNATNDNSHQVWQA